MPKSPFELILKYDLTFSHLLALLQKPLQPVDTNSSTPTKEALTLKILLASPRAPIYPNLFLGFKTFLYILLHTICLALNIFHVISGLF